MKPPQYVVLHAPGPAWKAGVPPFEQDGIGLHVGHYRTLLAADKLLIGGPFLDARGGGFMIAAEGVGEDELRAFAADDPAVRSGLLTFELRPWLAGMQR
jgi:uncharacterized protein YciI